MKKTILLFLIYGCSISAQVSQEWVARYNGLGRFDDFVRKILPDNIGNVYIAGSVSNGSSSDYMIIKYNSIGNQVWIVRYNGPGGDDNLTSMAIDYTGNVYVTGYSTNLVGGPEITTIKYDSSGNESWVKRYTSQFNGTNSANDITLDNSGNVYVTGTDSINNADYVTIKYDANGNQQWARNYNGTANDFDRAYKIVTDNIGNVYVTGFSVGVGTEFDYATIKYNSGGDLLWVRRYNGIGNEYPSSLRVDNSGNVYVAGSSEENFPPYNSNYVTIKYGANGNQIWIKEYDAPSPGSFDVLASMVLDSSGNVYVTGTSPNSTDRDFTTIKYDSVGNQIWISRYNYLYDWATEMCLDNNGNIIITGYTYDSLFTEDFTTIKYNSNGKLLWAVRYDGYGYTDYPTSIASDNNGNIYVTGLISAEESFSTFNIATLKYNPGGIVQWERKYIGPGANPDYANALITDNFGNVFVTGSGSNGFYPDYTTIKYNSNGQAVWISLYDGPGQNNDVATSIINNSSGELIVTGYSTGDGTNFDYATVKYDSAGTQMWAARYNGPANQEDRASIVAKDNQGNIYVTGKSIGTATNFDWATVKYNSTGNQIWAKRYNGQANNSDIPYSMAMDESNNIYVTGQSYQIATGLDATTIKYDSKGNQVWIVHYNGIANNTDIAYSIKLDKSNNIYVAGESFSSSGSDYLVIKYDNNGNQLWTAGYNGQGNNLDRINSMTVDDFGNIYVTGESIGNGTVYDYATIKYDAEGNQIWVKRYNGAANRSDRPRAIATDQVGNIYITGESVLSGVTPDYVTIKYDSDGNQIWLKSFNGSGNAFDRANAIVINNAGEAFITGESLSQGTNFDYITIKYSQTVGIQNISGIIPNEYKLYQNYPNPFNPATKINFDIPQDARRETLASRSGQDLKLIVFDIIGKEIVTLVNKKLSAGSYSVEFNGANYPSGIYYYKLIIDSFGEAGSFSEVKKMVLIK